MTAPSFRAVDALTGDVADRPSRFFGALSEADNFVREIDTVRELQTRNQELTEELADLREIHMAVVAERAKLRRQVETLTSERNTWRAAADA